MLALSARALPITLNEATLMFTFSLTAEFAFMAKSRRKIIYR